MRRSLLLPVLLLLSWGTAIFAGTAEPLLVESFEDGNHIADIGGSWSTFSDQIDGGKSRLITPQLKTKITPSAAGYQSNKAFSFSYALDKGSYEWDPYIEAEMRFANGRFNATPYQALTYWYKGDAHTIIMKTNDIADWAYYERLVPASTTWRQAIVPIPSGVAQPNWGEAVALDLADVAALGWRITGTTGDSGSLTLDNITFLDSFVLKKEYNLQLLDAHIPPKVATPQLSKLTNPLQARARQYLDHGVSLHNWLEEAQPFKDFRYDKADIARFAHQGFKGIRFPIDLDLYVLNKAEVVAGTKPFAIDTLIWTPLDSMVAWTAEYGLSLTIDYHQYDASLNRTSVYDAGYRTMVSKVWQTVAKRYSTNPRTDIFYELTNEPGISDDVPRDGWLVLAQQMVDSIIKVDTVHTLIYGDTRWYDLQQLLKMTPFPYKNMVYSFHYYEPFLFTHQGASWTGMGSTKNTPYPYSKELWNTEYSYFGIQDGTPDWVKDQYQEYYATGNRNALFNHVVEAKKWAIKNNVAVINNEFGAHPLKAQPAHLTAYFKDITGIFTELEIPWQVWFGPFDEQGELLPNMGEALGLKAPVSPPKK